MSWVIRDRSACLPWNFLPTSTTKLNILKPIFSPIAAPESVCFYENHAPNIMSHFKITHVKFIRCSSSVVIRVILWFHIWRASMTEFRNVKMYIDQFISCHMSVESKGWNLNEFIVCVHVCPAPMRIPMSNVELAAENTCMVALLLWKDLQASSLGKPPVSSWFLSTLTQSCESYTAAHHYISTYRCNRRPQEHRSHKT